MLNDKWQIKTRNKIYICLIFFLLTFANITLLAKLKEQEWKWARFTYEDGVALFNYCQLKAWPKTKMIVDTYWDKQTDFKNYLLKRLWE